MASIRSGLIRQHNSLFILLGRIVDVIVISMTLWAMLDMTFKSWEPLHTWWLLLAVFGFQIFAEFNGLYKGNRGVSFRQGCKQIFISWACTVIVLIIINHFNEIITPLNQPVFIFWCIAVPVELISWFVISYWVIRQVRRMGRNSRRVAIIGNTELGHQLVNVFKKEDWMGLNFVGFFDNRKTSRDEKHHQHLSGDINQLINMAKDQEVDIIYISLALKAEDRIKDILAELADTTVSVYYVPDLFVFDLLRSNLSFMQGIPIISIYDTPFYGVDGAFKRAFDIVLSLLILMLIAIPMMIIALSIKISSPGSVLFKQRRYGFRGEKIVIWKFRSMSVSEDGGKVLQAKKNDPRVTKLGGFLRKTSLDELPQFFNVLQGRMSIVGPRPHAVAHNELYRGQIHGYMLRHKVKPGITGLAQVSGFRGETDTLDKMEGRIRYDLKYIRNWSVWLDMKIVLLTIFKGFRSSKAY